MKKFCQSLAAVFASLIFPFNTNALSSFSSESGDVIVFTPKSQSTRPRMPAINPIEIYGVADSEDNVASITSNREASAIIEVVNLSDGEVTQSFYTLSQIPLELFLPEDGCYSIEITLDSGVAFFALVEI